MLEVKNENDDSSPAPHLESEVPDSTSAEVNEVLSDNNAFATEMLRTMETSLLHEDLQKRVEEMRSKIKNGRLSEQDFEQFQNNVLNELGDYNARFIEYFLQNGAQFEKYKKSDSAMVEMIRDIPDQVMQFYLKHVEPMTRSYINNIGDVVTIEDITKMTLEDKIGRKWRSVGTNMWSEFALNFTNNLKPAIQLVA